MEIYGDVMKKYILLLLILILIPSVTYAENNSRWYWVTSTDEYSSYINTKTLTYSPENNTAKFFVKMIFPSENIFVVIKSSIDYKSNTYTSYDNYFYQLDTNKFIDKKTETASSNIFPDTYGEKISIAVSDLINKNAHKK